MQVLAICLLFCIDASIGIDIKSLRGIKQKETLEKSNKLVEFETFFERSMTGMEYELLSAFKGSKCNVGYEVSKSACKEAAQSLGANQDQDTLIEGAWSWTPPGCFQNAGKGGYIHFSSGSGTNDGRFQSICKKCENKPPTKEYELLSAFKDSKCNAGYEVSISACKEAAQSLGANQDQDILIEGAWSWTPPGCFQNAGKGGHIHFSSGSGRNDGRFQSICKKSKMKGMKYELLSAFKGSKCNAGYEVSRSACKEAAQSLGANQYQDTLIEGAWSWTPPGCFQNAGKGILFSSGSGTNDGRFQSICKVMEYELLPAFKDSKCNAGYEVSASACKEAAQSLGANQDQDTLKEGAWSWTPPGCFQNAGKGGYIYFSSGSGRNNGRFQSICKKSKIKPPTNFPNKGRPHPSPVTRPHPPKPNGNGNHYPKPNGNGNHYH